MISVPSRDPVGALVPHTLKEPLPGRGSGPLAGLTFMVKDLFAIKGHKVSNGNPDFYEHATPARRSPPLTSCGRDRILPDCDQVDLVGRLGHGFSPPASMVRASESRVTDPVTLSTH